MSTLKRAPAVFFRTAAGGEPVRDWLKALPPDDRRAVGDDIRAVEFGWPVGMPLVRPMGGGLHEVRTSLPSRRIARVLFFVSRQGELVLLHAFIKKSRATPMADLHLAQRNKRLFEQGDE
jgi:phage-related protein